ncbi:CBS domain-containing protein [Spongiactinospora sp. TRM90649]|uniref:CBS domain-containing protein n=1 Tax=Spongiactinospora sp. TRM90649 TaxID=3031114 RepID=UPI0023F663B3|nr:CBS domain-containing protein [Spongiactinospora sp. TRM90649]MDF5756297.1 CBS domain-containing protein [Spongiactinospora sp. TRM90649]
MTTARDVMHAGCECLRMDDDLATAARRMAELDVGALPVCGADKRLKGIITDRDIVVKAIAKGKDPADINAGDLIGRAEVWSIDATTDIDEVLRQMVEHKVRRLPVLENEELIGIISQADLAAKLPEDKIGELVQAISSTSH